MPKILCTLPNASEEIGGIKFAAHPKGMLSEEVSDEQARRLASIPGYELVGAEPQKPASNPDGDAAKDAEKAALIKRAEDVGLKVKQNWSVERLRTEVEQAEKAAAEKKAAEAAASAAATGAAEAAAGDAGKTE